MATRFKQTHQDYFGSNRLILGGLSMLALLLASCGDSQADNPSERIDAGGPDSEVDAALDVATADTSDTGTPRLSDRDHRYCEVIPIFVDGAKVWGDVYNTATFNDCPQGDWDALDADIIKTELSAFQVVLNGPRYFIFDDVEMATELDGEVRTFGNLKMRLVATLNLDLSATNAPYIERTVDRDNVWIFYGGALVFELQAPDGSRYVMQSYSNIVDDTLTLADLPSLGSRLELPVGWKYESTLLEEDLRVRSVNGVATVLQDDLTNTYQKVE